MSVANHRCAFRPVRAGTLIFQPSTGEAGTLGMFLTSDGVDRWLLTCHHVLARNDQSLVASDVVLQPDAAAGTIAVMSDVVGDPVLDCAAVKLTVFATDEVIGIGKLAAAKAPTAGMRVIKSGWKTGVSEGRVQQVNGDDVIIERLPGFPLEYLVAARGDSGAIWVEAMSRAPVALHKRESAIGPHFALATKLAAVLSALNLQEV